MGVRFNLLRRVVSVQEFGARSGPRFELVEMGHVSWLVPMTARVFGICAAVRSAKVAGKVMS